MNRKVFFRADGNDIVCSGHIMRCLSLATALENMHYICIFVTADKTMETLITAKGFENISLETQWDNLDCEQETLSTLLENEKPAFIVVDTYYVTPQYLSALSAIVPTFYIDDLDAFEYPVQCVINYNLYGPSVNYKGSQFALLGPQFAPLREEFSVGQTECRIEVQNVLILTGGADSQHIAPAILTALLNEKMLSDLCFHSVVGALSQSAQELQGLAQKSNRVVLHQSVQNMAELMQSCDLAVSASGSTLYELCACGVPTVSYTLADNQIFGAKSFAKKNIMIYAGDMREDFEVVCHNIVCALLKLKHNFDFRRSMSEKAQGLIDGKGAERLAMKLHNIIAVEKNQHYKA